MKHRIRAILFFLTAAVLLLSCCTIASAEDGTITVALLPKENVEIPEGTITVALFQIGEEDAAEATGWRMQKEFSEIVIKEKMNAADLKDLAERVAGMIEKRNIQPLASRQTETIFGAAVFGKLKAGLYLGQISTTVDGLQIQPFIVALSSRKPGETNKVTVNPKYEMDIEIPPGYKPVPPEEPLDLGNIQIHVGVCYE